MNFVLFSDILLTCELSIVAMVLILATVNSVFWAFRACICTSTKNLTMHPQCLRCWTCNCADVDSGSAALSLANSCGHKEWQPGIKISTDNFAVLCVRVGAHKRTRHIS